MIKRVKIFYIQPSETNKILGTLKPKIIGNIYITNTLDPEELKSALAFTQQVIEEFYPPEGKLLGYEPAWVKNKDKILFRPDEARSYNRALEKKRFPK